MKIKLIFLSVIFLLVVVDSRAQLLGLSRGKQHIYETTKSFKIDTETQKEYNHNYNDPMKLIFSSTYESSGTRATVEITYKGKTSKYRIESMCIVGIYKDGIAKTVNTILKDAPFNIIFTREFNSIIFQNKSPKTPLLFILDDNHVKELEENMRYYQSIADYILINQNVYSKCSKCNGTGIDKGFYDSVTCDECNGYGYK